MAGADDLQDGAAVLLGPQLAVEKRQEAAAGALVEDRGVQPLQDRGAAVALAGQQAQCVPGQARDRRRLRARTADVADGEAVRAVTDREEVVEVAADFVALAGRTVDDLDLDAVDLGSSGGSRLRWRDWLIAVRSEYRRALSSARAARRERSSANSRISWRKCSSDGLPRVSMPMTRLRATRGRTTVSPPTAAAVARVGPMLERIDVCPPRPRLRIEVRRAAS